MEARSRQFLAARAVLERAIRLLPLEPKLYLTLLEYEELRGNIGYCETVFERWAQTATSDVWEPWIYFARRFQNEFPLKNRLEAVLALRDQAESGLAVSNERNDLVDKVTDRITSDLINTNQSDPELWWISLNAESAPDRFELALKQCQPKSTHPYSRWHAFALLWLKYAIVTETNGGLAHEIYERALSSYDHGKISSVTLWTNYLAYLIRQQAPLTQCRKLLGSALGKTRNNSQANPLILKTYVRFEIRMNELERTRKLLNMLCTNWPQLTSSWTAYAEFEARLAEHERSKHLFESSLRLSLAETDSLWVSYIETTADYHSVSLAREVAQRALRSPQVREKADMVAEVAMFELGLGLSHAKARPEPEAVTNAREIFESGLEFLDNEQQSIVYDLYIQFETEYGDPGRIPALRLRADTSQANDGLQEEEISDAMSSGDDTDLSSDDTNLSSSDDSLNDSLNDQPIGAVNPALSRLLASAQQWKRDQNEKNGG